MTPGRDASAGVASPPMSKASATELLAVVGIAANAVQAFVSSSGRKRAMVWAST